MLTLGAYLPGAFSPGHLAGLPADLTPTLLSAVFALAGAPALLLLSPVSDAFGPRPVLRAGIALAALGSACLAFGSGPAWPVVGRAAQGLALGAATGAAAALAGTGTAGRGPRRGAVLAGIAFVAGTAAGAAAGGFLGRYAPAPYVLSFVLHLALLALGWYRVSALAPLPAAAPVAEASSAAAGAPERPGQPAVPRIPQGMRAVFATASAVSFLAWTTVGLFLATVPALPARSGRHDMALTGCVLASVLVCSALTQPLVGRLGTRRAQLAGLAALLVSLAALSLTVGRSTSLTLVAAVVAGAGHGPAHAGSAAAVDAKTPDRARAAVTGALHLSFSLGSGLSAVAVGLLARPFSLTTAVTLVTSIAALLVLVTSVAVAEVDRAPAHRAPAHRTPPRRTRSRATGRQGEIVYIEVRPAQHDLSA
ncbi:MFS transporter [Streptomyces niger]|uniref:MFS transporter n=1 Tax=Streptomyces niger TaxID=66373 RepID=UPI001F1D5450|nr:MFS transporter [Streptomyces niger]